MRVRNIALASEREISLHSLPFLLDGDDVGDDDVLTELPYPIDTKTGDLQLLSVECPLALTVITLARHFRKSVKALTANLIRKLLAKYKYTVND